MEGDRVKTLGSFLGLMMLSLLLGTTAARAQEATVEPTYLVGGGTVTVLGSGSVEVKPDTASFTIGADVTRPTVPEALEESNAKLNAIIAAVKDAGVADDDIQTSNFSVYAVRDYNKQGSDPIAPLVGFTVSNQVSVTVRGIEWKSGLPSEEIGAVIGAAIDAGATDIYSVVFSASDPSDAERQARELAVANAHDRADQLATIAGKSVGEVIAMSEGVTYSPLGYQYGFGAGNESAQMGGAGGAPVYGGTVKIVVSVTVTYMLN
jgi:uncharacterized protein YggE